ncbi:prepilin-type N-terminal cleavage/methylation domain-containing protein [Candidatus Gottesmanbacteria bacterium]|nr:prepilin-type N-terminal cleavage/methylation domain-containing protein [Candidatus Gottesmanbacteria bacterium]
MKQCRRYERGQTLLEIVVALGVIAVVLTGLVTAVTASLRYSQVSKYRSQGVKFAQEGVELARKLRDTSPWADFSAYSSGTGAWCLNEAGSWSVSDGSGCPIAVGSTFWRTVTFVLSGSVMDVTSEVSWGDRSTGSTVTLRTYLSDWRQ